MNPNRVDPQANYKEIIVKIVNNSNNPNPKYQNPGDAGMDLYSNEDVIIRPGTIRIIKTGISIALPNGFEAQIRSRSGLATKGIFVLNSPGTVDSGYRGEIGIILANFGDSDFEIKKGNRVAQMIINEYVNCVLQTVQTFSNMTERGTNGFGSTNI